MSKVLLIGDAGVDVYHVGKVRGMSAEAPIPILDQTSFLELPAMGMNVFANLQTLGVDVTAVFTSHLPGKHRLVTEEGVQLARWDVEDWCLPYEEDIEVPEGTELIVVSGYGKGALPMRVVEGLKATGLPLLVDTKSTPAPWIDVGERVVMFPNLVEYEKFKDSYEWFPYVTLKCGQAGVKILNFGKVVAEFPSLAKSVHCVNGAGDTFLAGLVAALENNPYVVPEGERNYYPINFALAAAALVVEQPFTKRTVTLQEVQERMEKEFVGQGSTDWPVFDTYDSLV